MKQIKEEIKKYSELLALDNMISMTEAEKRASQFLDIMAKIADHKHTLSGEKVKYTTVQTAVYAQELGKGILKTVTENKINAEASENYIQAREDLDFVESDISYLKTYYDIFNNAHLFYRQMAKGNGESF